MQNLDYHMNKSWLSHEYILHTLCLLPTYALYSQSLLLWIDIFRHNLKLDLQPGNKCESKFMININANGLKEIVTRYIFSHKTTPRKFLVIIKELWQVCTNTDYITHGEFKLWKWRYNSIWLHKGNSFYHDNVEES